MITSDVLDTNEIILHVQYTVLASVAVEYFDQIPDNSLTDKQKHRKLSGIARYVARHVMMHLTDIIDNRNIIRLTKSYNSYHKNKSGGIEKKRVDVEVNYELDYMDNDDFMDSYQLLVEFTIDNVMDEPEMKMMIADKLGLDLPIFDDPINM